MNIQLELKQVELLFTPLSTPPKKKAITALCRVNFYGSRTNFKISHRSEFLSDFNHRMCVKKLRSRRIQKNKSHFSCVHFARRIAKIWGLALLNLFCAWWVHIKWDLFFWILRDLSFPTHSRWSKSDKKSLRCDYLNFVRELQKWPPLIFMKYFWSKGQKNNIHQILKFRTEASKKVLFFHSVFMLSSSQPQLLSLRVSSKRCGEFFF